ESSRRSPRSGAGQTLRPAPRGEGGGHPVAEPRLRRARKRDQATCRRGHHVDGQAAQSVDRNECTSAGKVVAPVRRVVLQKDGRGLLDANWHPATLRATALGMGFAAAGTATARRPVATDRVGDPELWSG